MKLELIERLEDQLEIGRIWIADENGQPAPRAIIGGVECDITTKPALLEAGLASCHPLDAELVFNWPMQARVRQHNSDGTVTEKIMECTSGAEQLVTAARHFNQLAASDTAHPGQEL